MKLNNNGAIIAISLALALSSLGSTAYADKERDKDRIDSYACTDKDKTKKGGGNVLPPTAQPKGYSLTAMAQATAAFNVSDRSQPPKTPFQILYLTGNNTSAEFNVAPGTMLYVPIFYNDDSLPVIGHLPNVEDRNALLNYAYSTQEFGIEHTTLIVDGKEYSLGSDYLVGVSFSNALADGAKNYMTSAAFLTPFTKGKHTVEISARATGGAFKVPPITDFFPSGIFEFSNVYTVNVH